MKPICQTKFSDPAVAHLSTGDGNCLMATVASLLHRPLESIPDFGMSGVGWFSELYEWCQNEGIGILYFTEPNLRDHGLCLGAYCMLVYSVKGEEVYHAVVGKTYLLRVEDLPKDQLDYPEGDTKWHWRVEVAHDPNPHGVKLDELKYFVFFIPPPPAEPVSWERMRESVKGLDTRPLVMGMGMACGRGRHHFCTQIGCGCACHKTPTQDLGIPGADLGAGEDWSYKE